MKKILLIMVILAFSSNLSFGQLSLDECYEMSKNNYPLIQQYNLIETSRKFQIQNISRAYIPRVSVGARASYQSEVMTFPSEMSNIMGDATPQFSKDQYNIAAELSQIIWDGGAIKAQKQTTEAIHNVSIRKTDVDMYAIRKSVNNIFFGVLLLDGQIKRAEIYIEELRRNHTKVSGYIENGVSYKSDIDLVDIEILDTKQSLSSFKYSREAYIMMLSIMIGKELLVEEQLVTPPILSILDDDIKRAELALFDAQITKAQADKYNISARNMPTINAFFNGAYAKPGLNFFDPKFSPYFITGVNLSWNFGNLYTRKNKLRLINVNVRNVEVQRNTFLYNIDIQLTQLEKQIVALEKRISEDIEIVELRHKIVNTAKSRVENGVMSVYDMMREMTLEQTAIQNKVINETHLLKTIYDFKYTTNN